LTTCVLVDKEMAAETVAQDGSYPAAVVPPCGASMKTHFDMNLCSES
jgi:hypothetical protein